MANNQQIDFKLPKGGLLFIVLAVVVIILFSKSTVTIKSGQAGVLYKNFWRWCCKLMNHL